MILALEFRIVFDSTMDEGYSPISLVFHSVSVDTFYNCARLRTFDINITRTDLQLSQGIINQSSQVNSCVFYFCLRCMCLKALQWQITVEYLL